MDLLQLVRVVGLGCSLNLRDQDWVDSRGQVCASSDPTNKLLIAPGSLDPMGPEFGLGAHALSFVDLPSVSPRCDGYEAE